MLITFLLQDNAIGIIKRIPCFLRFELRFETLAGCIFSFSAFKTLRAIFTLVFSVFFQLSFPDREFILSQLYLFIKGLIFIIPCRSFFISS